MLQVGDGLWIGHGYSYELEWLAEGVNGYFATVVASLKNPYGIDALAVTFESPVRYRDHHYEHAVLLLRHSNANWSETASVHVYLSNSIPSALILGTDPGIHAECAATCYQFGYSEPIPEKRTRIQRLWDFLRR